MELMEALYTTRSMRRMLPDPIPIDAQARILDAAIRAPNGSGDQDWRFLLVDDPAIKARLGTLYRDGEGRVRDTLYKPSFEAAAEDPDDPVSVKFMRLQRSVWYLADHFEEVPLFLVPFTHKHTSAASIYPSVWSAQLAARAEGIGSVLTRVLGIFFHDETLQILGVPLDEEWHMAGCVAFGYPKGRWRVAPRQPPHEVSYRNRWGVNPGFEVQSPLWPG